MMMFLICKPSHSGCSLDVLVAQLPALLLTVSSSLQLLPREIDGHHLCQLGANETFSEEPFKKKKETFSEGENGWLV